MKEVIYEFLLSFPFCTRPLPTVEASVYRTVKQRNIQRGGVDDDQQSNRLWTSC